MKRALINLVDALGVLGAFILAAAVRFEGSIPGAELILVLQAAPSVVLGKLLALRIFQCDRWSFRYAGPAELRRLIAALAFGTILGWAVILLVGPVGVSRAALLMEPLFSFFLLGAFRFSLRVLPDRAPAAGGGESGRRDILIVGAGEAGVMTLREILHHPASDMTVIGFIDDDPNKKGIWIEGVRVLGGREEIPAAVEALKVEEIVIAIPSAGGETIRELVSACKAVKTRFRVVPGLLSIIRGEVAYDRIREFRPEDLLGRETTEIVPSGFAARLAGRRILVTGAGGSIGSELARQLSAAGAELVLVDHSETAIYLIDQELRRAAAERVVCRIADLRNEERIRRIVAAEKPEIVFHAAAFKHVPLMEENVAEAIETNIVGTRHLVRAAEAAGVRRFVFISTDKAVRPTSVMGATKRAAEMLLLTRPRDDMRVAAVRFGNVFGSSGSAPLLFRRQIEAGGPVTVTHPHVVRYFMTIAEAVFLVIQAALIGEERDLFVLEMGQAVRILDLARNMITLAGLRPELDIPIVFTGLRPGEKLFEEILTEDEHVRPTPIRKIHRIARAEAPPPELERAIDELAAAARLGEDATMRELLRRLVPDYRA